MRIVVVEDHRIVREAVRHACTLESGWEVVCETGSGRVAVESILALRPDVVVLDVGLEEMDGFEVVEQIQPLLPDVRFLVFSGRLDDVTVLLVGQLGLHGFLDKLGIDLEQIRAALLALAAGGTYFSECFQTLRAQLLADPSSWARVLSSAELRALAQIVRGLNDREVGQALGISPRTVQTHRSNILRKLGLDGTPRLIAYAVRHGFSAA
ncbi:MAG: hypothetical protein RLZZ15_1745 [Verrucomicrobiota bacterium]|jgi:DNA-binding NarL/FixJ family response regulator